MSKENTRALQAMYQVCNVELHAEVWSKDHGSCRSQGTATWKNDERTCYTLFSLRLVGIPRRSSMQSSRALGAD
jgi:hypothetical protein